MREGKVADVWDYVSLDEVLANWELILRHLGRRREFWTWLVDGWKRDGLIA